MKIWTSNFQTNLSYWWLIFFYEITPRLTSQDLTADKLTFKYWLGAVVQIKAITCDNVYPAPWRHTASLDQNVLKETHPKVYVLWLHHNEIYFCNISATNWISVTNLGQLICYYIAIFRWYYVTDMLWSLTNKHFWMITASVVIDWLKIALVY